MRQSKVRTLSECAMMLALSIALSFVVIYKMPLGGSVTLFSMLPVMLVSVRHGLKWGLPTAFLYSLFQFFTGLPDMIAWSLTPGMFVASMLLDYLLAFTVLGLAGLFRKKGAVGCLVGMVLACLLRFFVHYLSGILLWVNYDKFIVFGETFFNRPKLYSFLYNGSFMLPETLMTIAAAALLFFVPQAKKVVFGGTDLATKKPAAETASNAADTSASSEEEHSVTCPCCSAHFTYRGVSGKCPYCNVLHIWGETDTNKKDK